MPSSPRRRPKNRKASIALAAAELFCARGYHNVGIEDIARAVGITGPAIYRHFPTKQAILATAVDELGTSFAECVHSSDAVDVPAERLRTVLPALVRFTFDRRAVARLYQWQGRHLDPEQRELLAERFDGSVRTLRDLLLQARPELPKRDAATLVAAALSVIASPATHRAALAKTQAERTIVDCATAVLTADLPAPRSAAPRGYRPEQGALLPRRERLLAEAVRLFHERGYHEVSISDIGEAAGINASSVYRHFASKADLLAAAYYRASSRLELATSEALSDAKTPAEAMLRLVDTYVRLSFAHAEVPAVYAVESENLPAADRHRLRVEQRRHVDTWVGLLSELDPDQPAGVLRFRVHAAFNVVTDLAGSGGASVNAERTAALVQHALALANHG
ncbi:TetR/AcrR family transcriptional regulator [Streptomyces sp. KR80]|uniref:TetR/AcrR family transcriptional regulator n=1 Tax=Streptomyces sp. KR80 TaxID=3457426 RepID=UPI003FD31FDC